MELCKRNGISAQTGLFQINYDDTREAVLENLIGEGFAIDSDTGAWLKMVPTDNYLVESVELEFSPADSTLAAWTIIYFPPDDEDIEEIVVDALASWHGWDYEYDEYFEEYYWDLGNDRAVFAFYDYEYTAFIVQYTGPKAE
ncbi:MAG: hypothetical protein K0B87_02400 [Candidatus Syntrophosphaera sp.]|nr:hypothetical protein [Candidatus Syntrophosphaera sp.]